MLKKYAPCSFNTGILAIVDIPFTRKIVLRERTFIICRTYTEVDELSSEIKRRKLQSRNVRTFT